MAQSFEECWRVKRSLKKKEGMIGSVSISQSVESQERKKAKDRVSVGTYQDERSMEYSHGDD